MKRVRMNPNRGSHLPILVKALKMTHGPVLELGAGIYSTPILHAICEVEKRKLVTYENNFQFFEWAEWFRSELHEVRKVEKWEDIDLSPPWSVAFVDHAPTERRRFDIARLIHADVVVAHDSDDRRYRYSRIYPLFKYQRQYDVVYPNTVVLSNLFSLEDMW